MRLCAWVCRQQRVQQLPGFGMPPDAGQTAPHDAPAAPELVPPHQASRAFEHWLLFSVVVWLLGARHGEACAHAAASSCHTTLNEPTMCCNSICLRRVELCVVLLIDGLIGVLWLMTVVCEWVFY